MTRTLALPLEGVLKSYVSDDVISPGLFLYHGLKEQYVLAILCGEDSKKAKYWLDVNGFTEHSYLIASKHEDPVHVSDRRMRQIGRLRQAGCSIDLAVEPDPAVAAHLMAVGIPVLHFMHPRYAKPEFRPDYESSVTPWQAIEEEALRQESLRQSDNRAVLREL